MKKYYIFDLDGTLLNSMPYWAKAMLSLLDKNGIKYPPDVIKIIIPLGMKATIQYFNELGLKITFDDFMKEVYSFLLGFYQNEIEFKESVFDYLKKLKDDGVSLNVLTASPKIFIEEAFTRLGVFDWFQNLWSCDDFGLGKTEPEIFKEVLDLLGAEAKDAVFFDDNTGALGGATKAGLCTVGVFDPSNLDSREHLIEISDFHINSFKELLENEPF